MYKLLLFSEVFTNGLSPILLTFISLTATLCGIFVIISKNPIVSVLFLIGLFLSIAFYLMMLGINFIGLSYLLVYVGAVSILFLFILMLINVRISELTTDNSNSIPSAIAIGISLNIVLDETLPSNKENALDFFYGLYLSSKEKGFYNDVILHKSSLNENGLFFVTTQVWDGALAETSHITSIGNIIYTAYPMWLIITSIILLLAMVGAIVITIKQT